MDEISLAVPEPILDSFPDDDGAARKDMKRAVEGWERRINRAIADSDDDEAAGYVLDAIELFEERMDTYDAFVPELRAWGQSPIYAICWRNLMADLIGQLYEHEELAERLDRERNQRVVEDGIRLRDL
ncbi:hypothetical protein ACOZ4N_17920 [Halorientalis pallida]|uniref:hypothetical protein n=1 Tax=Halorientalis pallida TaxID=2479928 RepID=UPI003C6EBF5D